MKKYLPIIVAALSLAACTKQAPQYNLPAPDTVVSIIKQVNTQWQESHPLIAATDATYTTDPDNEWTFKPYSNNSPFWDNAEWVYNYGEKPRNVLFGDWQICFQTYCDLYNLEPDDQKIARAREVMEYEMSTSANDYWWWADGLYMVMPVMTKLYNITGNEQYLQKLTEYWTFAKNLMYDGQESIPDTLGQPMANVPQHLFYRDGKYLYPKHASLNGSKDFWARGCGWVVAGLAKVLADTPDTWKDKAEFRQTYIEMCEAVKNCQQPEGYWTRSLLDPEHAPGPETSGTAFFTYGLLWGVNNGLLDREAYMPTIVKAWEYLTNVALQEDGSVGYVQPIGERAIPGQTVDQKSISNFGTGAFLLACCEMYRLVK